jgi:membrane fusion protein (multidrug efflux system)
VAEVLQAPFRDSLEALGTVQANESVQITANRADQVTALHFNDGQFVEKGQLLLEMSSVEEKAELSEAIAVLEERKLNFQRDKELFEQQLSSGRDFETSKAQLSTAEARVRRLEAAIADRQVLAPFAGVLGLRRVSVGAFVQPGTVVTTLDDIDPVKVDFTIPETWLSRIHVGMPIAARSDTWPNKVFEGRVETISTRIDPVTRSATLRAILPNPKPAQGERMLRPGMLLKLEVQRDLDSVLQVPEEALIPVGSDNFVLRVDAQSKVARTQIEVGRRRPGMVEVLSGLSAGQRVVVEGILRARPGGQVEVVKVKQP